MDYKARLKIGILVTAIITAIIISDLLPLISIAITVFLFSMTLTFFVASDYVKTKKIKEMALIIKGLENINAELNSREILVILANWIKRIINSEEYYLVYEDELIADKWARVINSCQDVTEPKIIEDKTILPIGSEVILYIPIIVEGKKVGKLISAHSCNENMLAYYLKLIEPLVNATTNILINKARCDLEIQRERRLFTILNRAREAYSPNMIGHGERVAKIALALGKRLGLNNIELGELELGALLHDIGQVAVLFKNLNLKDGEKPLDIKDHPVEGHKLIPDKAEYLEIKNAILYHHEYYNGTGYPEGLSYTNIPIIARIIAVADVYDALTCLPLEEDRKTHEETFELIKRGTGSKFDPLVVVALEELRDLKAL